MGIIPQRYDRPKEPLRLGANPRSEPLGYAAGQMGFASVVANQGGITSQTPLVGLSTTVLVGASRRLRIYVECYFQNTAVNVVAGARLFIQEDGIQIQQSDYRLTGANVPEKFIASWVLTPTAGTHTYRATADNGGGGTVTMVAGVGFGAYILVEDIGAA